MTEQGIPSKGRGEDALYSAASQSGAGLRAEQNPYAPPAVTLVEDCRGRPLGYPLYLGLNLIYAILCFGSLLILLSGRKIGFEFSDFLVVAIFLVPLISGGIILGRCQRLFRRWWLVPALICGVLVAFCLHDFWRGKPVGIGLFMASLNLISLMASSYFYVRRERAAQPNSLVQAN